MSIEKPTLLEVLNDAVPRISQSWLIKQTGLAQRTIWNLTHGRGTVNLTTVQVVSKALGIDPGVLITLINNERERKDKNGK